MEGYVSNALSLKHEANLASLPLTHMSAAHCDCSLGCRDVNSSGGGKAGKWEVQAITR